MSAPAHRALTQRELERDVNREVARIRREQRPQMSRRRCRVCQDPDAKRRVNEMLAYGMRPQSIVDNIGDINSRRRKNEQIGYWSVRDHRINHFNLDDPVKEAHLRILERRAAEEGAQIADGVGSILTLRGYLEIIASKGFQKLLDTDDVGYTIGLDAQRELEKLMKDDAAHAERVQMRRDVALIQQAIMETLTDDQMRAVSRRLDVLRGIVSEDDEENTIEGEVVDEDDEDYEDDGVVASLVMDVDEEDTLED